MVKAVDGAILLMHRGGIPTASYRVESNPAGDTTMAHQKKQEQIGVHAIATALAAANDSSSPVADAVVEPVIPAADSAAEIDVSALSKQSIHCTDISQAIDLINVTATAVARLHRAMRRKQPLQLQAVKQAIDALIDNFQRAPNALFWALVANRRMYYLCRRAVGTAVWALALGNRLDFERKALQELMLGALLLDIGKINVPVVILAKASRLNSAEQNFARRHVVESIRMLEAVDGLSEATLEMVRLHHERLDGNGYPFGLKDDEIPLYARIAGIVDTFDALSLSRYYAEGLNGHDALATLQAERGVKFDPRLIDEFISAIGEFPTGSWVEFADGTTGIVCSQDPVNPQAPQVALIADANKQPFLSVQWLKLHKHSDARLLPPGERPPRATAMERSLQSAIYGRPKKH